MLLSTQIQSMLYALLCGLIYGLLYSMHQYFFRYVTKERYKTEAMILFHFFYPIFVYYGLYHINGGVSNLYLFLLFILGVYGYYLFYYHVFIYLFDWMVRKGKPIYVSSYLLLSAFYSIMVKQRKWSKRGKNHQEKKKKKSYF